MILVTACGQKFDAVFLIYTSDNWPELVITGSTKYMLVMQIVQKVNWLFKLETC